MRRRDLLKATVITAAAVGVPSLLGCTDNEALALTVFSLGVASGDPRETSVVLWTRVEPGASELEDVRYELALDENFGRVVAQGSLQVGESSDFTLRVKVTGLSPATKYWYRFQARKVTSTVGQTKTAPASGSDVPVRFAFATCQDLVGRYFHAWKVLADEKPVDFVLFLGDYIYETTATAHARVPTEARRLELPDGLALGAEEDGRAALTLADFRAAYRQYKADPDLRKVHALFPFIAVWDDHEFGNDCWQDHTNHFDGKQGDEQNRASREAATQAFCEYLPLDPERDPSAPFPADLTLFRSLRFGKHLELFVTDQRYYRSDHVIPEGPADPSVGKYGQNTILGSRSFVIKEGFDLKEAQANPTMLGLPQRDWLIEGVKGSDATWKAIGSQTMVAQLLIDLRNEPSVGTSFRKLFYLKTDQWDGYRTERRAILEALSAVQGVVWFSGDLHATYASELRPDFDTPGPATAVEYLVPGISAVALQEQLEIALTVDPILGALGLAPVVRRADNVVRAGNPHLQYARNKIYGVATVDVDRDQEVRVTFLQLLDVQSAERPATIERVSFRTRLGINTAEPI
jgi:alkaline phosphatase D